MANLIDRLPCPAKCLEQLPGLLPAGGQLIIATPCTWLEEYTPKAKWLGGSKRLAKRKRSTTSARGSLPTSLSTTRGTYHSSSANTPASSNGASPKPPAGCGSELTAARPTKTQAHPQLRQRKQPPPILTLTPTNPLGQAICLGFSAQRICDRSRPTKFSFYVWTNHETQDFSRGHRDRTDHPPRSVFELNKKLNIGFVGMGGQIQGHVRNTLAAWPQRRRVL